MLLGKRHERNLLFCVQVSVFTRQRCCTTSCSFLLLGHGLYWQTLQVQCMQGCVSKAIKRLWGWSLCKLIAAWWICLGTTSSIWMPPCLLDRWYRTSSPRHPSYIFTASLGNGLWNVYVLVCLFVAILESPVHTHTHIRTHCAKHTCVRTECVHVCVCVRRGVVRQLTRCANDHLTAESHYVLQQHTALYCLCCHSDIVFSTIKCWYWLIVLASSGLFFLRTHTQARCRFILLVYSHTHMHTHTLPFFYSLCIFYGRCLLVCPGTNLEP